ncbi:MAG TPA: UvrD-helicase domain-containing protein [Aldersonia sp.]
MTVVAFDIRADLPEGTTVLEASAGTGKTYAIVGLATRFLAEGKAKIADLLLVTFSRAATQELRERARGRIVEAEVALADPAAAREDDDDLIRHLADVPDAEVAQRRRRLREASSDFDAGMIVTTHGFCQRMIDGLGFAGDYDPDLTLVEQVDDLLAEVVTDLYLARYGAAALQKEPPVDFETAAKVAKSAVYDRQARLVPETGGNEAAQHRFAFARDARAEVALRKQRMRLRDYDDLLGLLHDVLVDTEHGEAACARIRSRFRVVLVDEFQDTDPLQWEILSRTFHGHATMVLVGDPKQAIYAFRGAEVLSYLDAVRHASQHQELTTNWRSDAALLTALDHLYGGKALGHEKIVVGSVNAAQNEPRLLGSAPLRVRYLPRMGPWALGNSGLPAVSDVRPRIAADVARDIVDLLTGPARYRADTSDPRPVEPGDVTVLARTHDQVSRVRSELEKVGVPSVLASGTSVFLAPSATHWLWLLYALEQPHRPDRVRIAALTPLLGWTAAQLAADGERVVATVSGQLRELASLFAQSGFAAVFERVAALRPDGGGALEARLHAIESGERELTDVRHIAQLLNRAAVEQNLGLSALSRWLTERIDDPESGVATDRTRRLESDAAAVQIATVHVSKGLEYPIVYVPYAWSQHSPSDPVTALLHDAENKRVLDVGGNGGPDYREHVVEHNREDRDEELRLLYVAVTRAKCQVVLWWAPSSITSNSPLHRLMFDQGFGPPRVPRSDPSRVPRDEELDALMQNWAAGAPGVAVEPVDTGPIAAASLPAAGHDVPTLAAARFERLLDRDWRRTSYSALTASAHDAAAVAGATSEVEDPELADEPETAPPIGDEPDGIASTMNDLPFGAAFGTLVHEVLEHVDTAAADLRAELVAHCTESVAVRLSDIDPVALADALAPVMRTPLGEGVTLAEIAPGDRLPELDFEFPLLGGDTPHSEKVTIRDIAALLRKHLPADDALAAYPDELDHLDEFPLRGYLTGSIDAVLRLRGPRYLIVDYKTNRLGHGDLTVGHYTRDRMAAEMLRAHYPLQALLYSVALHRYLRWRQPGYAPHTHLGAVLYLFVRGMVGPQTPPGSGVFDWHPPADLIVELSDLLAGGRR